MHRSEKTKISFSKIRSHFDPTISKTDWLTNQLANQPTNQRTIYGWNRQRKPSPLSGIWCSLTVLSAETLRRLKSWWPTMARVASEAGINSTAVTKILCTSFTWYSLWYTTNNQIMFFNAQSTKRLIHHSVLTSRQPVTPGQTNWVVNSQFSFNILSTSYPRKNQLSRYCRGKRSTGSKSLYLSSHTPRQLSH